MFYLFCVLFFLFCSQRTEPQKKQPTKKETSTAKRSRNSPMANPLPWASTTIKIMFFSQFRWLKTLRVSKQWEVILKSTPIDLFMVVCLRNPRDFLFVCDLDEPNRIEDQEGEDEEEGPVDESLELFLREAWREEMVEFIRTFRRFRRTMDFVLEIVSCS